MRSLKSLLMTMKEEVFMLIEMERRLRGKDMFWTKKIRFNNPQEYEASNIIQELKEGYTRNKSWSLNMEQCTTMSASSLRRLDNHPAGKKSE